jgi:hypothetical protein
VTDPRLLGLLRALPPGKTMWLSAAGNSLWPFVLSGDQLRVERCGPSDVARGDLAVVDSPGTLIAHIVVEVDPVVTASSVGVRDPEGLEVLGRVTAVRRGTRTVALPRASRHLLGLVPRAATVAKRSGVLTRLVRGLRDRR